MINSIHTTCSKCACIISKMADCTDNHTMCVSTMQKLHRNPLGALRPFHFLGKWCVSAKLKSTNSLITIGMTVPTESAADLYRQGRDDGMQQIPNKNRHGV